MREFFESVEPHLNERQRRVVFGSMAEALGRGGQKMVAACSSMSTSTLSKAVREVRGGIEPSDRLRVAGGGDRPAIDKQPGLLGALDALVYPDSRGDPMSPLRWTGSSELRGIHSSGVCLVVGLSANRRSWGVCPGHSVGSVESRPVKWIPRSEQMDNLRRFGASVLVSELSHRHGLGASHHHASGQLPGASRSASRNRRGSSIYYFDPIHDDTIARTSPAHFAHLNVHGTYDLSIEDIPAHYYLDNP